MVYVHLGTQVIVHMFIQHKNADLVLFLVYAAFCVLHFEFSFLTKLVPQKSSGAVGKGKIFF